MTARMSVRRALLLALALCLAACGKDTSSGFQGWIEADLIFVSPDEAGRVVKLNVREGENVDVGAGLYSLDDDLQQADLNQTRASQAQAKQSFERASALSKTGSGTLANLDSAVWTMRIADAQVVSSETRLARRRAFAPIAGSIQQIYFREGESVPAQRPILSILPPGNMKIRFYVAEPDLPKLSIGGGIRISCDGCATDLAAKIYYISTTAEYTPPVIYSQEERRKLVYLVQARPDNPVNLRVGQPVSVTLQTAKQP